MKMIKAFAVLLFSALINPSFAQDHTKKVLSIHLLFTGSLELGGDEVAKFILLMGTRSR